MVLLCGILVLAICLVCCHDYWNCQDANARVKDAWEAHQAMSERRDALVEENRELQRRLETIEDAIGTRE